MKNQVSAARPAGRPLGVKQKIPAGHVGLAGLGDLLGLSPATIPSLESRGDPRIPPRSPLAGSGRKRRAIWRIEDVQEHILTLASQMRAAQAADEPRQQQEQKRGRPRAHSCLQDAYHPSLLG